MLRFREPKYPRWGFNSPDPNLIKVPIDLRPFNLRLPQSSSAPPSNISNTSGQLVFPGLSYTEGERIRDFPPLLKKEDQKPGSNQLPPFGSDPSDLYFGGPIFEKAISDWRTTFFTRSKGDVVGALENQIPLPTNIDVIISSTCVISGPSKNQSGFWIGPRLILSTLHFHNWIDEFPSVNECDQFRQSGISFAVESEITNIILNEYSPRVQLVAFDVDNDVGLFKLQDRFADQKNYVDINWIMEGDDAYSSQLQIGTKAACCGFNGSVSELHSRMIQDQAAQYLSQVPLASVSCYSCPNHSMLEKLVVPQRPAINLDHIAKPGMKSFAPGTVDYANGASKVIRYGVSASVWKGSSGGPCIILEGPSAGAIIGTVRGADSAAAPFNSVNGFPTGARDVIRKYL